MDRQRPLTAPWLGIDLPIARTKSRAATLEVTMLERKRMEEGDQMKFRWKWNLSDATLPLPKNVSAEMVGAADIRVIDMRPNPTIAPVVRFWLPLRSSPAPPGTTFTSLGSSLPSTGSRRKSCRVRLR